MMLICGGTLLATSVLAIVFNLVHPRWTHLADAIEKTPPHEYSFVGEDYPMYFPLDIRHVLLVPEDTVHYGIVSPDADAEWESIPPPGKGFVHLGGGRTFGIALYHQMHCLDTKHVHHCFNYLREAILCEADTAIEPGMPTSSWSSDVDGAGMMGSGRTCKDWTQVYMAVKEAHEAEPNA
ncbi:hypothetical protein GSI_14640 [Ganoderma sinense ZZ0214-1]|uniref:Uncharacterized protein n=1 Tax=Ganoderma sinense ZZ0214-1 TaxID=1077348 RepID=A0A2G8RP92_9APHY|nr:hypothetical protein GSI_14640 [Ganoderma sinense ZZ0214-1]